ncbi:sensor histidine kinase [Variovorax terrae]|uniref:histidine kinase n=1 Tax=Variovorax terrae TaxID=2923278 RepID=A0A9X1VXQ3_9BURK|nr:HAMP domain-containing sensor histidine kinase [Variovorax terrae]MCJ0765220.1 HAMP domain-containing histidine kinase [Variovorax terrae]
MNPPDAPSFPADAAQQDWVESRLITAIMDNAGSALAAMAATIPVIVVLLYREAWLPGLLAWAGAATGICLLRLAMIARYRRHYAGTTGPRLLAFWQRCLWAWPASALIWGGSMLLYFGRGQTENEFVCMMVLVGMGAASVSVLSASLRCFYHFTNALGVTVTTLLLYDLLVMDPFNNDLRDYAMLVLVLVFWGLIRVGGKRFHRVQRSSLELQYHNNQLIESLTRQTQTALDAVGIKNRFLASAAHDIRQPVHALGLYADWLSSEPELVREIAPKIVESTKAVNALFDSLFDLARLDSGKIRINIEQIDVAKLLRDLELQYRPLAEAKGLRLRLHVVPGQATSDPILLQRILGNLIANAVKYTARGGILVASRVTRRGMRIEIWDTGVGIAPEHQREIFREFYKAPPSHAGTEDGFGLGLYIVSRLSNILGHPLRMSSRPGRGTVFRLALEGTDAAQADARAVASLAQLVNRP